ncbi:hypothetical protein Vretimale_4019, partial [Volvox reticuliferus]
PRRSLPQPPVPDGRHANYSSVARQRVMTVYNEAAEVIRVQQAQAVMAVADDEVHAATEGGTGADCTAAAAAAAGGHDFNGQFVHQQQTRTRRRLSNEMVMADLVKVRHQEAVAAVVLEEEGRSLHISGDVCMSGGCCCTGQRAVAAEEVESAEEYRQRYTNVRSAGCQQGANEGGGNDVLLLQQRRQQQLQQQHEHQEWEGTDISMRGGGKLMAPQEMDVVEEQVVMEVEAAAVQTAAVAAQAAVRGMQELIRATAAVQQVMLAHKAEAEAQVATQAAAQQGPVQEATAAEAPIPQLAQGGLQVDAAAEAQVAQIAVEAAGAACRAAHMQMAAARAAAVLAAGVLATAVMTAEEDATYLTCPFTGRSYCRSSCLKPGDVPLVEQLSDPSRTVAANQDREVEAIVNETFSRRLGSSVFLVKWLGYELDPGEPGGRNGHWVSQAVLESWVPTLLAEWRLRNHSRQKSGTKGGNLIMLGQEEEEQEEEEEEEQAEKNKEQEKKKEEQEEKKKKEQEKEEEQKKKKKKKKKKEQEKKKEEEPMAEGKLLDELSIQGLSMSWLDDVDLSSQDIQDVHIAPPSSRQLDRDGSEDVDVHTCPSNNKDGGQQQQDVEVVPPAGYTAGLNEDEDLDINVLLTLDEDEDPEGWQELVCRATGIEAEDNPAEDLPGLAICTSRASEGGMAADPSSSRVAAAAGASRLMDATDAAAMRGGIGPVVGRLEPIRTDVDVVGAGAGPGPSASGPSGRKVRSTKKRLAREPAAEQDDKPAEEPLGDEVVVFMGEGHHGGGRGAGKRGLSQSRRRSARIQAHMESMQQSAGPPPSQLQAQQPPAKRVALLQDGRNGGTAAYTAHAAHNATPAWTVGTTAAPAMAGSASTATTVTVLGGATTATATAIATNTATATATGGRRKYTAGRCKRGAFSVEAEARLKAEISSGSFVQSVSTGRKYPKSLCCGPKDIRVEDYNPDDEPEANTGIVERIMDEAIDDITGRRYLLIKWKGYELDPGGEDRQGHWEPVGHVPKKSRARAAWERSKPFWFEDL